MVFEKGSPLVACVNEALADAQGRRDARGHPAGVALRQGERSGSPVSTAGRQPRLRASSAAAATAAGASPSRSPARSSSSALIVARRRQLARLGRGAAARSSPATSSASRSPRSRDAFVTNVKLFLVAEAVILVTALAVAVLRSLPGPVFFPLRLLAVAYVDLFRGVPTILVIYILGFGAPALAISGRAALAVLLGRRLARARLHGVRRRGLPRRDRVGAPEPGGGSALARADAAAGAALRRRCRRPCAGSCRRSSTTSSGSRRTRRSSR